MSETNGLSLGIIIGQYASALFIGAVADRSCRISSLLGSGLFIVGYSSMAISLSQKVAPSFIFFVGYFLLVGAGTVCSYFAALTASAKSFPAYPGLAIGIPSAMFGTSPLVLSAVASALFTKTGGSDDGDIDAVRLFIFLAVLLGSVNLLASFGLRPPTPTPAEARGTENGSSSVVFGEETPLLARAQKEKDGHLDLKAFLSKSSVWIFLVIVLFLKYAP